MSDDETEYNSFTVCKSKDDADTAGTLIREKVMPKLEPLLTAPPEVVGMQVYEPKV